MSESVEYSNLDNKNLISLTDASFEEEDDDSLFFNSPFPDPPFLHFSDEEKEQKIAQTQQQQEQEQEEEQLHHVIQPLQSLEQQQPINTTKSQKYNLRKSLAWDTAFFTSDGVLEPDELSTMIGVGVGVGGPDKLLPQSKHVLLPAIEEDLHASTDSFSTLATTDTSALEDDLFGDIRASIQKSTVKSSNAPVSQPQLGSGLAHETKLPKSSEKLVIVSQNKLKAKTALKKPNVTIKGSGKMQNLVPPSTQTSKSASRNSEATTSSVCKPPKMVGRPSAILATTAATKRASLGVGANRVKMEKDGAKNFSAASDNAKTSTVTARGAKLPAIGSSRNNVPKPVIPVKSSLRSSVATKKQLTTSTDSLESLSSDSSNHSSTIVKRKTDPKTSSTGSTVKTTLRTASRNKNQPLGACTSPYLKSATKFSSSISPASSVSECSSESLSPTSTLNKRSNSSRPSLDNGGDSQVLGSQNRSSNKCTVGYGTQITGLPIECAKRVSTGSGALVRPDSIKPSGLRMPSPKIGFFDGGRSTVRTPSGSSQSHLTVSNDSPRFGAADISPSGGSKSGRLQPARTVMVRGAQIGVQQPASELQPKSVQPVQESSRNGKNHPNITLKVQNRKSPNLKAEKVAPKECNTGINNPDFVYADTNDSLCRDKMSPQSKGDTPVNESDLILNNGGSGATHNSSSTSEVENVTFLQEVCEDAICGSKTDLHSLSSFNENGKTCVDNQVDGLVQLVEALDIHRQIQQKPVTVNQVNESTEVNTSSLG